MRGRHVILTCPGYQGWEYGMLRCLEAEIQRQTGATVLEIPKPKILGKNWLQKRLQHGTRYEHVRKYLPKEKLEIPSDVDVVWYVLMGPENYGLDLFDWPWRRVPHRVVYLFDTLPSQIKRIGRLFSGPEWNFPITSFQDAIPMLKNVTGRNWCHIDQAVSLRYFPEKTAREIAFSSYGRRHPRVHEAIQTFCRRHSLYYDYTTHGRSAPAADPLELYRQYAWHLGQSLFTVSWPVEVTHPERAGELSPITCRWFEAAAAGATVIGQAPKNPRFGEVFGKEMVLDIDPESDTPSILLRLEDIWENREQHLSKSKMFREKMANQLDWRTRVDQILQKIRQKECGVDS